ncbi:hypothetical protein [Streptomyces sp. NPDC002851]
MSDEEIKNKKKPTIKPTDSHAGSLPADVSTMDSHAGSEPVDGGITTQDSHAGSEPAK